MMYKKCQYCGCRMEYYAKDCINLCRTNYKKDSDKHYDNNKRNKKHNKFYNSSSWKTTRSIVLTKYCYICLYSLFVLNKIVEADTVHHINELDTHWDKRLNIKNLIPLCTEAHNTLHGNYKEKERKLCFEMIKKFTDEFL